MYFIIEEIKAPLVYWKPGDNQSLFILKGAVQLLPMPSRGLFVTIMAYEIRSIEKKQGIGMINIMHWNELKGKR